MYKITILSKEWIITVWIGRPFYSDLDHEKSLKAKKDLNSKPAPHYEAL